MATESTEEHKKLNLYACDNIDHFIWCSIASRTKQLFNFILVRWGLLVYYGPRNDRLNRFYGFDIFH